ncbi:MAG TPA: hypothetical protein VFQ44_01750 [Streptosporangiaceae bacterium]|nr:hypothetical protein [Streptosporangiaceae bacterium]
MTPRAFCESDLADIAVKLAVLPFQAGDLADAITVPARQRRAIRVPFGPRLIIDADADALLRLLVEVAVSWHQRVAEARDLYPVDLDSARRRALTAPVGVVSRSATVLREHLDVLLGLPPARMSRPSPLIDPMPDGYMPDRYVTTGARELADLDGVWAGNEIIRVHYLAREATGIADAQPERLKGVPCRRQTCEAFALRRAPAPQRHENIEYWSRCDRCGDSMTEPEYRQWVRRYAIWCDTGEFPVE